MGKDKISLPKFRITTNGELFGVQILDMDGEWVDETYGGKHGPERLTHESYRSAIKWIRRMYGNMAQIEPREWRLA